MTAETPAGPGAQGTGAKAGGASPPDALVVELEQRLRELEQADDGAFGEFTGRDWLLLLAGAVVIPGLLLAWFAP